MTTYLVECYWPGVDEQRFTLAVDRLAASNGLAVTWKSSILIPDDEIVLCLASGPSVEAVRESARRAGVAAERVVPCVVPSDDQQVADDRSESSIERPTSTRKEQQ